MRRDGGGGGQLSYMEADANLHIFHLTLQRGDRPVPRGQNGAAASQKITFMIKIFPLWSVDLALLENSLGKAFKICIKKGQLLLKLTYSYLDPSTMSGKDKKKRHLHGNF